MDLAGIIAQEQRAIENDPGELARQRGAVDRRARRKARGHPLLPRRDDRVEAARDVAIAPALELRDPLRDECFAIDGERDRARGDGVGHAAEVDADADDHRIELTALALGLDEHARELLVADQHVVRPLQRGRCAERAGGVAYRDADRERDRRNIRERQRRSHDRREVQATARRGPCAAFAAPARFLALGDHDRAVARARAGVARGLVVRGCARLEIDALTAEPGHRTSNPISTAGAEWVSAPTEIRSAPVRALSSTVASVTPPEPSTTTLRPCARVAA